MSEVHKIIRPRERQAILDSLRAGVTPRTGLQHIQVGRVREIKAVVQNLATIADGGAAFRLIIGEYGSGKSFFLQLMKTLALEKNLVVASADLSPERRLYSTSGHGRNLYRELVKNISTKTRPDGNALVTIVERFISQAREKSSQEGLAVSNIIRTSLRDLQDLVGGYDFASVVNAYWLGYEEDNQQLKDDAIRWLRGEFSTKTEARQSLNVRTIISDADVYDSLKLLSLFAVKAGYGGLLINLDEMVNLYKLANKQSRISNYEQILRMLNDCLQGSAANMGFLLGGTPEFLTDRRRGLYSYEALHSRLVDNPWGKKAGTTDYYSPVLELANLTTEELYVLLGNLRKVFAGGDPEKYLLPDAALQAFLDYCAKKIGDSYFRTPRNTIRAFVQLLSQIEQYPDSDWKELLGQVNIKKEEPSGMPEIKDDDDVPQEFNIN